MSTDGGQSWSPSNGPLTMNLREPSAIEAWRMRYFGTTLNAGNAADMADPEADGNPNIIEFATGSNPWKPHPPSDSMRFFNGQWLFTFTRAKEAIGAATMFVEWSTTLLPGSWQAFSQESVVLDDGVIQTVEVTIPAVSGDRCFARLHVEP